jgi:hypothetical protein
LVSEFLSEVKIPIERASFDVLTSAALVGSAAYGLESFEEEL